MEPDSACAARWSSSKSAGGRPRRGRRAAAKSLVRLLAVDPGFRPSNALVVTISVPSVQHYVAILDAIRAIPGVEAAGSIRDLPLQGKGELVRPDIAGRPSRQAASPMVQRHHVSTDYFKAMGIPLRAGRTFETFGPRRLADGRHGQRGVRETDLAR